VSDALSRRLRQVAERMAARSFAENVAELVGLAGDDLDALQEAIREVQSKARTAGTPEHIAFTLLAAAWRRIADDRRTRPPPTGRPEGGSPDGASPDGG
jgi:hypothetical protein